MPKGNYKETTEACRELAKKLQQGPSKSHKGRLKMFFTFTWRKMIEGMCSFIREHKGERQGVLMSVRLGTYGTHLHGPADTHVACRCWFGPLGEIV